MCSLTGIDKGETEQHLASIKDAPGFVERGAAYYRVTPELIAMIAFSAAWKRWAEGREEEFLSNIPETIQEGFLQRVSESANSEVRNTVQGFFRRFADTFTPRDLADFHMVNKLISLVETEPATYLPALKRIVQTATPDELKEGTEWSGGSWGTRRQLVWLAERFAQFPEFFFDCEELLFLLAQQESEPDIGNNATKIWQQFFRVQLSGTAVPFVRRLELLQQRIERAKESTGEIIAGALDEILDMQGTRILGPPVVAGRIPPADWRPHTAEEVRECIRVSLRFIDRATHSTNVAIAGSARKSLIRNVAFLSRQGWVDELRPIVKESALDESDRAQLVGQLRHFLTMHKHPGGQEIQPAYAKKIADWIGDIKPDSFHGRLVEVVGGSSWDHYGRENEWRAELKALATELLKDAPLFSAEEKWLSSAEATSSFEFGYEVGTLDVRATSLDRIIEFSLEREVGFLRGYVAGLIHGAKIDPTSINERLDRLETERPLIAFQVALAGGSPVNLFNRAVRLISTKSIPPHHLRNFTFWVGEVRITNDQVLTAMGLLLPFAKAGDVSCCDVLMDFLGARLHDGQLSVLLEMNQEMIWEALRIATEYPGHEVFWWGKTLSAAAPTNPGRGDSFGLSGDGWEEL